MTERVRVVATVMIGTISTVLAATIVNVTFPAIMRELEVGHATLQWVSTAFLAATATTMLGTAWSIETWGERRTFIAALALFLAGSALGALAWNATSLCRPNATGCDDRPPAAARHGRTVSRLSRRGARARDGPLRLWHRAGAGDWSRPGRRTGGRVRVAFDFRVAIPLLRRRDRACRVHVAGRPGRGAPAVRLARYAAVNRQPRRAAQCDGGGTPVGVAIARVVRDCGRRHRSVAGVRRVGKPCGDSAADAGAIPPSVFRPGVDGVVRLRCRPVRHDIPGAGVRAEHCRVQRVAGGLPAPGIALALAIIVGGRLADRIEPRFIIVAGLVLFASSSLLLAFAGAATGFWLLTAWLVIGRAGLGMLIPALNVAAVASLSGSELAYASSSVNFVRQLGGAVGVNVLAVLLEWRLGVYGPANAARAFHECFALVTLAFALAIMPAWSIRESRR